MQTQSPRWQVSGGKAADTPNARLRAVAWRRCPTNDGLFVGADYWSDQSRGLVGARRTSGEIVRSRVWVRMSSATKSEADLKSGNQGWGWAEVGPGWGEETSQAGMEGRTGQGDARSSLDIVDIIRKKVGLSVVATVKKLGAQQE